MAKSEAPALNVITNIPLSQLKAATWNARTTFDRDQMLGFTSTISKHGIQSPLIVRALGKQEFEIVAGHRRSEAAKLAGLDSAPCIVRELTDEQAAEVGLIDNLQRVDIQPMEEAEAFGELLNRSMGIEAVAAIVGKEVSYVARRLKLLTLTAGCRSALSSKLITIDHAMLFARVGEEEQNAALKWTLNDQLGAKVSVEDAIDASKKIKEAKNRFQIWEPKSVARLKSYIEQDSGIELERAPWPMGEDWLLPDAGSCLDCPKNTLANAPLFGDLNISEPTCTDGSCFKAKTEAFVLHGIETAKKSSTAPLLRLSWAQTQSAPRFDTVAICKCGSNKNCKTGEGCRGVPKATQVFKHGQWVEVSGSTKCDHISTGVTTDWSDAHGASLFNSTAFKKLRRPGEIIEVCIASDCKVHPKTWVKKAAEDAEQKARGNDGAVRRGESYEAQQARQKKEIAEYEPREAPIRRALYDAIAAKITPDQIKRLALYQLAEDTNGSDGIILGAGVDCKDWNWEKKEKYTRNLIDTGKGAGLDRLLLHSVLGPALEIEYRDISMAGAARLPLRKAAKNLGLDALKIERSAEKTLSMKLSMIEKRTTEARKAAKSDLGSINPAKPRKAAKPKKAATKGTKNGH